MSLIVHFFVENSSDYVNIVLRFKSQKEKRNTGLTKGKLTYPTKVSFEAKSAKRSFASNRTSSVLTRSFASRLLDLKRVRRLLLKAKRIIFKFRPVMLLATCGILSMRMRVVWSALFIHLCWPTSGTCLFRRTAFTSSQMTNLSSQKSTGGFFSSISAKKLQFEFLAFRRLSSWNKKT